MQNDLVANMTKAMGGSGKNKPQLPKGKGRGRIDDTHQVAVLTDLEAHALNTLRWEDKDGGYSSGSGPKIKKLAAQNTRPFDFVEYKGEKIPTLNDSSSDDLTGSTSSSGTTTYSYSGGDDSGGGGESNWARTKRLAEEKRQRELKAEQKRRQDIADKKEAEEKYEKEQEAKRERAENIQRLNAEIDRRTKAARMREQSTYTGQDLEELDYQEQDEESELTDMREDDEAFDEAGDYVEYPDPDEEFNLNTDDPDPDPDPDPDDGMTDEEFNALAAELELEPEFQAKDGSMHWTQEDADVINAQFDAAKATAEGTLGTYGTDTYGTDYMSGLTESYTGSFADERQTEYDAALEGIYDDFKLSGVWDQTAYDEALAAVDAGVLADQGLVDTGATAYSDLAQGEFDTWLAAQTAEIQELYGGTDLSALSDWTFSTEEELDDEGNVINVGLDLSAYDPTSDNYNPDLMDLEGVDFNFLEEFKKIYPSGTTTPGATDTTGGGETSGEVTSGVESTGRSSVRKTKKEKSKVPAYTSSPFSSGGSSSTIN